MSLDPAVTNIAMFAAHDQVDVAALEADGLFYRCFVWLNRATWTIETCCYRLQTGGGEVEVFHNVVAQATSAEITAAAGIPLDSPKIIPVGTTFVVHWLQALTSLDPATARAWMIYRATMDMEGFSSTTWDDRGATSLLETHMLYDVCPVLESEDFVVARYTMAGQLTIARYNGFDWIDTSWIVNVATTLAPHVLAAYAHATDGDVICTFETEVASVPTGNLFSVHVRAADGLGASAITETMTEYSDAAGESGAAYVQVGHCRVAANVVAVVAEALASSNADGGTSIPGIGWMHHLVYRTINSATAAQVSNIHWASGLHMCSRPFAYAAGSTISNPTPAVYVLASLRGLVDAAGDGLTTSSGGSTWSQAYHYGLNLDYHLWDEVDDGAGLRPRVVQTLYSVGIPDARSSGWHPEGTVGIGQDVHVGGPTKRMNHISYASAAPPFGPDVKTRTIGAILWAQLREFSDDGAVLTNAQPTLQPEHADASAVVFYLEDPQTAYRDASDPTQPVGNFAFANPRAMCQQVEIGRALVSGGGTLYSYDGQRNVELGYVFIPEIIDYVVAGSSGSQTHELSAGQHSIWYHWTWRDNAGQQHRSQKSNVITVTVQANDILLLRCRTMPLSLKDATAHYALAPSISLEFYATPADDQSIFYRVFASDEFDGSTIQGYRVRDTPRNDPTAMSGNVLVYFGLPDTRLVVQGAAPSEFQYNADLSAFNGPLPVPWPACSVIAKYRNRLWAADSTDPSVIWYSDEIIPEPGGEFYTVPELAAAQFFRIGDLDSEITAMKAMGDSLIVFTRSQIYEISIGGEGLVTGTLLVAARQLHDGLGCTSPRSVVSYPLGLMFQSGKGYYGLDRSGEATYGVLARSRDQPQSTAGASFEDDIAEAGFVMAASHDPKRHRVSLAVNGRPTVTQTWTGTIVVGESSGGDWTISGLPTGTLTVAVASAVLNSTQVGDLLQPAVQALIDADAPTTLQFEVASVSSPGGTIVLELEADVDLTLTGDGPGDSTLTFAVVETLDTQPRVVDYYYDVQQSARAELVQTSTNTRLAEVCGGTYWQGDTGSRNVVLTQGAVLIEHDPSDADAYADQTSSGSVGIPIDLTTSWIHFGGIAGWQRTRRIGVVTEREEDGAMHVDLEFDRDGSLDGQQIQPQTMSWTSPAPAYLKVPPREQRCSSVRMRIYEDSGVTTAGNTVTIVALVFEVGLLPGTRRVSDAQVGS